MKKKQEGLEEPKAPTPPVRIVALSTGEVFEGTTCETRGAYRVWRGSKLIEESGFAKRGRFKRSVRRGLVVVPVGQDPERVREEARREDGWGASEGELLRAVTKREEERAANRKIAQDRAARAKKPCRPAPRGSKQKQPAEQLSLLGS